MERHSPSSRNLEILRLNIPEFLTLFILLHLFHPSLHAMLERFHVLLVAQV